MVGSPVQLIEECQETSGKTMKFFKASERVQVDGNDSSGPRPRAAACPGAEPE